MEIANPLQWQLRSQQKKERKELKAAAKQSLDVGHWTKEVMNGSTKFAAKVESTIEDKLSRESVSGSSYAMPAAAPTRSLWLCRNQYPCLPTLQACVRLFANVLMAHLMSRLSSHSSL